METLSEAIARLEKRGFVVAFRATPEGLLIAPGESPLAPESLVLEETVRFEGASNPDDQAVLFALRSRDGHVRGTFVSSFGIQTEPANAAVIHRLRPDPKGA